MKTYYLTIGGNVCKNYKTFYLGFSINFEKYRLFTSWNEVKNYEKQYNLQKVLHLKVKYPYQYPKVLMEWNVLCDEIVDELKNRAIL